ncbi:LysR family transcriptional regulator [Nonomuraea pusilla]|uniref:DNA-binding transcriptional regulator, LysR family n=1 Tax=Nonomuraea pusilla TaxID=46177 RepID=A0A1H7N541_9ACTN|nr:LysR substrate-binding domain-containing protein [Nonomuraea pusilla]SEL18544.1 DNA-binding transcriptional regulator, LysR family [Nonomuraea pusilla]
MELRQLLYMVATAEESSFTRAAARVRVAQPAVSQQIAQLERELGQRLFDRSERRVRLTPAGEAFLPHAKAVLEAAAAGRDAVDSLRGVLAGRLTVGTVPVPPAWLLDLLAAFRRRHPRVRLTLRTGDPEGLASEVASGALDLALIGVAAARLPAGPAGQRLRAGLASRTVSAEPLVVAVAPGHPLAAASETTVAALRGEPLLTLTHGSGLRAALIAACSEAGFLPDVHTETDDLTLLADLAARGFGAALMPRSAAERSRPPLAVVPLAGPALLRTTALVWPRDRVTAPARAFLDLCDEDLHDEDLRDEVLRDEDLRDEPDGQGR